MGQTTITVTDKTLERFKQLKDELDDAQPDAPDHNADSFLNGLLDTWEAVEDGYYSDGLSEDRVREIAREEISDAVVYEALE